MIKTNVQSVTPAVVAKEKGNLTCSFKMPKVIVVNEFTEKGARSFRDEFAEAIETEQTVIPIVIDSYGGYVYSLLSMVDTIKNSPVPVATIATGKAMSCGAVLFTCGSENMRYMADEATLMIHDVSAWACGKVGDMEISVKEAKRLNRRIYALMEDNIGKKKGYLWNLLEKKKRRDWYITAKQAKKYGIATHIGVPKLTIDVSAKLVFE
jgi:ATP-dependent Clp endopeptidase proteolytic subunit ClpP